MHSGRAHSTLAVAAQATLCVNILGSAALAGASFGKLSQVPDSFEAGNLVVARLQLSDTEYPTHEGREPDSLRDYRKKLHVSPS
jgi:hypothetical protein